MLNNIKRSSSNVYRAQVSKAFKSRYLSQTLQDNNALWARVPRSRPKISLLVMWRVKRLTESMKLARLVKAIHRSARLPCQAETTTSFQHIVIHNTICPSLIPQRPAAVKAAQLNGVQTKKVFKWLLKVFVSVKR